VEIIETERLRQLANSPGGKIGLAHLRWYSVNLFPGLGLGIAVRRSRSVPSETFLIAAQTLADKVSEADRAEGRIYPPLYRIREISLAIATRVAESVYDRDWAGTPRSKDVEAYIRNQMYEPNYRDHVNP